MFTIWPLFSFLSWNCLPFYSHLSNLATPASKGNFSQPLLRASLGGDLNEVGGDGWLISNTAEGGAASS